MQNLQCEFLLPKKICSMSTGDLIAEFAVLCTLCHFHDYSTASCKAKNLVADLVGVVNESSMVDKILEDFQKPNMPSDILGGIVFTNLPPNGSTLPSHIHYKIRLSSSPRNAGSQSMHLDPFKGDTGWKTGFMFPPFQKVGPRENASQAGGSPGRYFDVGW